MTIQVDTREKSRAIQAEFENGKHRYNALWDLVVKCKLVEEYEAWEWAIQDGDEE